MKIETVFINFKETGKYQEEYAAHGGRKQMLGSCKREEFVRKGKNAYAESYKSCETLRGHPKNRLQENLRRV